MKRHVKSRQCSSLTITINSRREMSFPSAEFPVIVQFSNLGEEPRVQCTPPPFVLVEFPVIVQPVSVGEEATHLTPGEFPEITQSVSVAELPCISSPPNV